MILAKVATFLRGLNLMMPFLLCAVGSSFAMRRFGYDNEAVSIFVAFCTNAMEIFYMFGCVSTLVFAALLKYGQFTKNLFNYIVSGMSMVSVCYTAVNNVLLLRLYALDDDVDNITRYYWLFQMANFAAGIDVSCIATLSVDVISNYEFGFALTGIVVAGFHLVVIKILECLSANVDYWLLVLQLVFIVMLSTFAAVIWFWYLIQDRIVKTSVYMGINGSTVKSPMGYLRCVPMVLGSSVALGTLWGIYPYISPFKMVAFKYQYPIQRICLVFQALCGISLWLLDNVGNCVRHDWYKYPYAWWHLLWLLYVPYFGIAILFFHCMHYPESGVSRAVLMKPFVVGPLTVLYYCLSRTIYGLSPVPISKNALGHGEVISPMNKGLGFLMMNILKYMSEAYLQEFKLAKEGLRAGKAWPTDGMSKNIAFRHWVRIAARVGYSNFKEMASADVKQRLGSVPRHIISYRGANP